MLVYLENNGSTRVNGRNFKCCPRFSLGLTYPTQIRKIVGQRTAGCQIWVKIEDYVILVWKPSFKPNYEYSYGSTEFPCQHLRQFDQGILELWSKQTDKQRDYFTCIKIMLFSYLLVYMDPDLSCILHTWRPARLGNPNKYFYFNDKN